MGYHSNRRVPDRRALEGTIIPLYRSLKAIENGASDRKVGLEKASAHLMALLEEKGVGYDEFIFSL